MRPDGKRKKNCAKEKFCAPCIPHTAARKWQKNSFLAARVTQWLVTRAKGCAHGSSVGLKKKLCAQLLEATGQEKIGARDTHAWQWGGEKNLQHGARAEQKRPKKNLCAPSREVTGQKKDSACTPAAADRTQKKICARIDARAQRILHGALTFACKLRPDSPKKSSGRAGWQSWGEATGRPSNKKFWRSDTAVEKRPDRKNGAHRPCWAAASRRKKIWAPSRGSDRSK
jgi:hypothetical protein